MTKELRKKMNKVVAINIGGRVGCAILADLFIGKTARVIAKPIDNHVKKAMIYLGSITTAYFVNHAVDCYFETKVRPLLAVDNLFEEYWTEFCNSAEIEE